MPKIIYPNGAGGIAVVHPTGEIPIAAVALKDVPAGVPYLIVDDAVVPAVRAEREGWSVDFSTPDGFGIGQAEYYARERTRGRK